MILYSGEQGSGVMCSTKQYLAVLAIMCSFGSFGSLVLVQNDEAFIGGWRLLIGLWVPKRRNICNRSE